MRSDAIENPRSPNRSGPSIRERRLSFILLGALMCIALALFAVQFRYDPAIWRAQPSRTVMTGEAARATVEETTAPSGLRVMSPPEHYDARTLSDKINGKAELYLSAGFESLESRRYALSEDPGRWMELFVYDMGRPSGAFAALSQQRRAHARPLDLAADAYRSANGIFLVQGRYYVEIIGSDRSEALLEAMTEVARSFVRSHPAARAAVDERSLLPDDRQVPGSIALTAQNAFGFERFDRIFTAQYQDREKTAMAFVSRRASAPQAAELVDAYSAYLLEYGGRRIDPPAGAPPVVIIEILDMFEIIFYDHDILAGIHEATDLSFALDLAGRLHHTITEAPP